MKPHDETEVELLGHLKYRWACLLIVLCLFGSTSCVEFEGVIAPLDELFFPVGIEIHPSGRWIYVVNSNFDVTYRHDRGGTVTVIDTDTSSILPEATINIGSFGGRAQLAPDARHLYVAVRGDSSIYRLHLEEEGRGLSCQGASDGLPCRLTGLASDPMAIHVSQLEANLEVGSETPIDLIVTTSLRSNTITAISIKDDDPSTAVRLPVDLITGGSAIAVHPRTGNYYVSSRFSDYIRVFLPVIGREGDVAAVYSVNRIGLPNPSNNYDTRDITFSVDGDRAYVSARRPNSILVIDTSPVDRQTSWGSRDRFLGQIDLQGAPSDLVSIQEPDGEYLYVLEYGSGSMVVVDPLLGVMVDRFYVGEGPTAMSVDQHLHQRIYVTLFNEAAVAVVDIDPESPRYRTTVANVR